MKQLQSRGNLNPPKGSLVKFAIALFALTMMANATWAVSTAQSNQENRDHPDQDHEKQPKFEGRVFDSRSGGPVANAMIKWAIGDVEQIGYTDSNGLFSFLTPTEKRSEFGDDVDETNAEISVTVIANLYITEHTIIRIHEGRPAAAEIGLGRKPSGRVGTVKGILTNSDNGQGISNAAVTILGAGETLSAITGPEGNFTIDQVGFNADLKIQFTTSEPPCIAPLIRPLVVASGTVAVDISTTPLKTLNVNCAQFVPHAPGSAPSNLGPPGDLGPPVLSGPPPATLPTDGAILWHQADSLSIQINSQTNAWHAGHVNDILVFGFETGLLAASDTGGVFTITSNSLSTALSNGWAATTSMTSLAPGPDGPRHIYAGTYPNGPLEGGVLWETDTSTLLPISNWRQVSPKPPCGTINKVLVINEARRIVLACDTGVYWSQIPPPPSAQGKYAWIDATPPDVQQGRSFASVVKGLGWTFNAGEGSIVASKWGGYAPGAAIYNGKWSGGTLQFVPSIVDKGSHNLALSFGRSSLASCPADLSQMFALAEDGLSNFAGVWRSGDGGLTFKLTNFPVNPGGQGNYNNVIAISPNCKIVALGWQNGTFVSFDAGNSWNQLSSSSGHLHSDIHALAFDPSDPATLFIGSDGGVASASGLAPSSAPNFRSDWNRELFDLQIGLNDGSPAASGLVAGALQDNGVIWAGLPGPWLHVTNCGCDGSTARFLAPPALAAGGSVLFFEEWGLPDWPFGAVTASGNSIPSNASKDIPSTVGVPPLGGVSDTFRYPGSFSNSSGQLMSAVEGTGLQVYGLFAWDDGSDLHWQKIDEIGGTQYITAISPAMSDTSIFVGTSTGSIYRLDAPYTAAALQLTVTVPPGANGASWVEGIAGITSTSAYAAVQFGSQHYVMFWNGSTWRNISGSLPRDWRFGSIIALSPSDVYVTNAVGVYDTHDAGATWNNASNGLPVVSNAGEIRAVVDPTSKRYVLYLSTYGRSLWTSLLP